MARERRDEREKSRERTLTWVGGLHKDETNEHKEKKRVGREIEEAMCVPKIKFNFDELWEICWLAGQPPCSF